MRTLNFIFTPRTPLNEEACLIKVCKCYVCLFLMSFALSYIASKVPAEVSTGWFSIDPNNNNNFIKNLQMHRKYHLYIRTNHLYIRRALDNNLHSSYSNIHTLRQWLPTTTSFPIVPLPSPALQKLTPDPRYTILPPPYKLQQYVRIKHMYEITCSAHVMNIHLLLNSEQC